MASIASCPNFLADLLLLPFSSRSVFNHLGELAVKYGHAVDIGGIFIIQPLKHFPGNAVEFIVVFDLVFKWKTPPRVHEKSHGVHDIAEVCSNVDVLDDGVSCVVGVCDHHVG